MCVFCVSYVSSVIKTRYVSLLKLVELLFWGVVRLDRQKSEEVGRPEAASAVNG